MADLDSDDGNSSETELEGLNLCTNNKVFNMPYFVTTYKQPLKASN
jgi:hypothetical protein